MKWIRDICNWWGATKPGDPYAKPGMGGGMDNGDKVCATIFLAFIGLLFVLAFICK